MIFVLSLCAVAVLVRVEEVSGDAYYAHHHHEIQSVPVANNTGKTSQSSVQAPPTMAMESHIEDQVNEEDKQVEKQSDGDLQGNAMTIANDSTTATMNLIVNCCNESLGWIPPWTLRLPRVQNVFIYNKCEKTHYDTLGTGRRDNVSLPDLFPATTASASSSSSSVVSLQEVIINNDNKNRTWDVSGGVYLVGLPNVGREGHSWLTHFLYASQDHALSSDWNLLLQGNPEASLRHALRGLRRSIRRGCDYLDLFQYKVLHGRSSRLLPKHTYWGYQLPQNEDEYAWLRDHICELHDNYTSKTTTDNRKTPCGEAVVALRGEFIIHKSLIAKNRGSPQLHGLLQRLSVSNNPLEGHFLERAWIEVLGTNRYCDMLPHTRRVPPADEESGQDNERNGETADM